MNSTMVLFEVGRRIEPAVAVHIFSVVLRRIVVPPAASGLQLFQEADRVFLHILTHAELAKLAANTAFFNPAERHS